MIVGDRIVANLPRILISATEPPELIKFAVKKAQDSKAAIISLYVQPRPAPESNTLKSCDRSLFRFTENPAAREAFKNIQTLCSNAGVPALQIYAIHNSLGEMLLDHAVTWGVEAVVMSEPAAADAWLPAGTCDSALHKVHAELPPSIPLIIHRRDPAVDTDLRLSSPASKANTASADRKLVRSTTTR